MEILSPSEIDKMRFAGRQVALMLESIGTRLKPGVSTLQIDSWVREITAEQGGKPSQLGYGARANYAGFPAAVCTSVNSVVCHGIPSAKVILREGDIVNVDVTSEFNGFHGDTSATWMIGSVSPEAQHLVDVARRCRDTGISVVREGARLGDIGAAIDELARREGCSVVREYGGHGIGRKMHLSPHISHFGVRGSGQRLRAGMAFTIEPMINLGRPDVTMLDDDWTVVTQDGQLSAQFEHTIIVTKDGAEIMTLL